MVHRPRATARVWAFALVLALLAVGCADTEPQGGAEDLPGPLPSGVVFHEPPEDAMQAPDFSGELLDGTPVTASDLWDDRPLVLVFTASWCNACADRHRDAARVVDDHDGAVALLGVVEEGDAEGAADYARDLRLGHPIAITDERAWLSYAADEPGLVALVSHGGKVLRGWPGGVDADVLAGHIDDLIADASDHEQDE